MNLPHPSLGDNHITRKITHGKTQENQRNWLFLTKQLLRMKKLNFNLCDQAEHSKSRPQLVIGVVPNPKNANNDKRRLDFFGASSSKIKNGAICAGFILWSHICSPNPFRFKSSVIIKEFQTLPSSLLSSLLFLTNISTFNCLLTLKKLLSEKRRREFPKTKNKQKRNHNKKNNKTQLREREQSQKQ